MTLTDAQYIACVRALLGMGDNAAHLSEQFALDRLAEICDPAAFRRALGLAYQTGLAEPRHRVRPRATCGHCGREVAVRLDGTTVDHNRPRVYGRRWADRCPGSHQAPAGGAS